MISQSDIYHEFYLLRVGFRIVELRSKVEDGISKELA
jgi:hypothetical protein